MANLSNLTDAELEAENQRLMAERAEVEKRVKEEQMEVQAEVARRDSAARLARIADTLSDDDKEALRQHLALPAVEG